MFIQPYQEPQSERLLLVQIETPQGRLGNNVYRHITASVIRRAVSHVVRADNPNQVEHYWDDYVSICSGYRNANYVFSKNGQTYVGNLQLRGQFEIGEQPLREGRPYGIELEFCPPYVGKQMASAINNFFTKYAKFLDVNFPNPPYKKDFHTELCVLAKFLKITTLVFPRFAAPTSLSIPDNFEEVDLLAAEPYINSLFKLAKS